VSDVRHWVIVSNFRSFFCVSKVMETLSAVCSRFRDEGSVFGIAFPALKKLMFRSVRIFVRLSCGRDTFRYSHDRHAKKKAPMVSSARARRVSVNVLAAMRVRMQAGSAFSWRSLGSTFLYARSWRYNNQSSSPSSSFVGFR
jgi:hypothetical protein